MAVTNSALILNNKIRAYKTTPVFNKGGSSITSNMHTYGNGQLKDVLTNRIEDANRRVVSWTETSTPETAKDLSVLWNNNNPVKSTIQFDGKIYKNCYLTKYPDDAAVTKDITIEFVIADHSSY